MTRRLLVVVAATISSLSRALPGWATTCNIPAIQAIAPKNTTIGSAVAKTSGAVSFCDISASITTDKANGNVVNFELGLPDASAWNSRFLFTGNGGFAGSIGFDSEDVQNGFTVAATDTGHQGDGKDATWALNNTQGVKDFQYRAVHKSTVAAQEIISNYYNNATYYSYFSGCSTGGRQALVEAEKYPNDYDGILAGDPAMGDPYIHFNWNFQALLQSSDSYLDPNAVNLVDKTVTSLCDPLDGVTDGLIQNPAACTFDPNTLLCASGQTSGCLTSGQVATLDAIYADAVDTKGNLLYPGFSKSNPAESDSTDSGWGVWITGCRSTDTSCDPPLFGTTTTEPWSAEVPPLVSPGQWTFSDAFLQYFVYGDPSYDSRSFSWVDQKEIDKVQDISARWGSDGMKANIKSFVNKGHKLLMYHGWSDPALTPFVSVNYYNSVQTILGSTTSSSVRLFMVPGMHHCQGGPGPNVFDALTPLTQWVEVGTAPDGIIATHYKNNDSTQPVDRTMPLCSYPELAQYNGVGPVDEATSWSCPSGVATQPTAGRGRK